MKLYFVRRKALVSYDLAPGTKTVIQMEGVTFALNSEVAFSIKKLAVLNSISCPSLQLLIPEQAVSREIILCRVKRANRWIG
jgi:hypothetical protein